MSRTFIFISLFFCTLCSKSQTSFNCYRHEYCYWNEISKKFHNCKGFEEKSLFVVDKDEKAFTFEVEHMKSNFLINEKAYDKENEIWTYHVSTAEGIKYTYFFDVKNKEIRFVPDKPEKSVMESFIIKSIF